LRHRPHAHLHAAFPVAQRSSIILMDVLGYSLDEIGRVTDQSTPAIKASLHRGRARLPNRAGAGRRAGASSRGA